VFDFNNLKKDIQKYFEKGGAHSFKHTERVYNLAMKIAKNEKVDLEILKAAVLLHDVARLKEVNKEIECHAEEGSKMASSILKKHKFPYDKIDDVIHCIKVHRKLRMIEPKTIEAKILQDADRLDITGAIGIMRIASYHHKKDFFDKNEKAPTQFQFKDKKPETIINWMKSLFYMTPDTFKTKTAKKLCKKKLVFLKKYIAEFEKEWDGE
jgi:uncharacterized protein|tara:strand:- start:11 stop:640 length:630 start_codon:yes stop_codon:yes gene_type:complete